MDFTKEAEVYHFSRIRSGLHHYGGCFHFVGTVEVIGDEGEPLEFLHLNENFSWWFSSKRDLADRAFAEHPVVQVIFDVKVPWVLEAEEPQ